MTRRFGTVLRAAATGAFLGSVVSAPVRADQTVQVGPGTAFSPAMVTVAPGEAVIWSFQALHTSTSDSSTGPEVWDSNFQSTGTFSHTFNTPGSYPYYCQLHSFPGGTAMNGVVVVSGAGPTPTATPTTTPTPPSKGPTLTPVPAGLPIPLLDPAGTILFAIALAAAGLTALRLALRR